MQNFKRLVRNDQHGEWARICKDLLEDIKSPTKVGDHECIRQVINMVCDLLQYYSMPGVKIRTNRWLGFLELRLRIME